MSPDSPTVPGTVERIVAGHLGAALVSANALEGGFGGAGVYRARIRFPSVGTEQDVIVKLGEVQGARVVADDDVDRRVYGARSWSLAPVHALLRAHGLPTYDLLGWGFPTPDVPFFWIAMSALDGQAVRGADGAPDPDGFHRSCGEALGALHAVTRPFDGFVDQAEPYPTSWTDAFFRSLDNALARVLAHHDPTFCAHEREIRAFVDAWRARWVPPREFALSHPDGLQGVARSEGNGWRFIGHLDLEDYTFTDARFPLAGYELGAAGPVPPSFWDGYRAFREVDPIYDLARAVFKLYFLLDWFWIVYNPRWNPTPAAVARGVARQTNAILRTIRSS